MQSSLPLTPHSCSAQWAPLATLPAGLHRQPKNEKHHGCRKERRQGEPGMQSVSSHAHQRLFWCCSSKPAGKAVIPAAAGGLPMETPWVGLSSPSISALLRYRAREKPTLWGAHSGCPVHKFAVVSCRGAARSQLHPRTHHLWDPSSKLCHPREAEEKSHNTQATPRAPHPMLPPCWVQTARHPQRSRERNDLLLLPLPFCKQGSLYS